MVQLVQTGQIEGSIPSRSAADWCSAVAVYG